MIQETNYPSNVIRPLRVGRWQLPKRQRRFELSKLFRSILPSGSILPWLALQSGAWTPDDGDPLRTLTCPNCGNAGCGFVGAGIATADEAGETTINMVDSDGRGHRVGPFLLVLDQGDESLAYPQGKPSVFSIAECDDCGSTFGFQLAHECGRLILRVSLCVDLSVPSSDDPIPAAQREGATL